MGKIPLKKEIKKKKNRKGKGRKGEERKEKKNTSKKIRKSLKIYSIVVIRQRISFTIL